MNRLLALTLLLFWALTGFSQTFRFGAHSSPADSFVAAHGDLNGDGYEDVILGNYSSNDTAFDVLLSNGDGTFRAPVTYTYPGGVNVALIADLNGDGKIDVLAFASDPHAFVIYFGKGGGTFLAPTNYILTFPDNWGLDQIIAADVNHDNKTDLIFATTVDNHVTTTVDLHVLFANGDGSFRNGPTTENINRWAGLYFAGDFDGDGKVDVSLGVNNADATGVDFRILYGDDTGKFSQPYDVADPLPSYAIAADVNGDGKTDLIATTFIDPVGGGGGKERYLTAFYGRSDRTMARIEIPTDLGCGEGYPAVADFNGDHVPDIAFEEDDCSGSVSASSVAILPGRGNNDFGPEQVVAHSQNRTYYPQALRANRDTKADIIFEASDLSNSVVGLTTLLNQTTGSFSSCAPPNAAAGIALCSPAPGSTVSSPVDFAVAAAGDTPMRKAEVWADGHKIAEQLAGAFSDYSFLDASVPLAPGSHYIVVFGAGWDNSLESRSYNLNVTPPPAPRPVRPASTSARPQKGPPSTPRSISKR
jgi:FG-GAP-like repeat